MVLCSMMTIFCTSICMLGCRAQPPYHWSRCCCWLCSACTCTSAAWDPPISRGEGRAGREGLLACAWQLVARVCAHQPGCNCTCDMSTCELFSGCAVFGETIAISLTREALTVSVSVNMQTGNSLQSCNLASICRTNLKRIKKQHAGTRFSKAPGKDTRRGWQQCSRVASSGACRWLPLKQKSGKMRAPHRADTLTNTAAATLVRPPVHAAALSLDAHTAALLPEQALGQVVAAAAAALALRQRAAPVTLVVVLVVADVVVRHSARAIRILACIRVLRMRSTYSQHAAGTQNSTWPAWHSPVRSSGVRATCHAWRVRRA